jgi:ligand-binding sensor domain-containing protein
LILPKADYEFDYILPGIYFVNKNMKILYSFIFFLSLFASKAQNPQWIVFDSSTTSIPTNTIYQIAIDDNNNVYCGSDLGILKFDGANWTIIDTEYVTFSMYIPLATYGNKAYYSKNDNLRIYDGTSFQTYTNTYGISTPGMGCLTWNKAIAINDSGIAGIASYARGLGTFDGLNTWNLIDSTYRPFCVATKYNNFWLGTVHNGLVKYDGIYCTNWDSLNSTLPTNTINSITIDYWGNIWMGSSPNLIYPGNNEDFAGYNFFNGLIKYDHTGFSTFTMSNSAIPDSVITSLASDTAGNVWIGSFHKGLIKYDGNNWVDFDTTNSPIPQNFISWIALDHYGNKWISFAHRSSTSTANFIYGWGIAVFNENGVIGFSGLNKQSINENPLVKIFPNPTSGNLQLEIFSKTSQNYSMILYDTQGKERLKLFENKKISGSQNITYDVSSLKSGMYFYKLFSDQSIASGKIIIQK